MSKSRSKQTRSELIEAARRLQIALTDYEDQVQEFGAVRLNTQHGIERAAESLTRIAALEQAMLTELSGLLGVLTGFRDRQQQQASTVEQRAAELVERRQLLQGLLGEMVNLTEEVKGIRGDLQAINLDGGPAAEGAEEAPAAPGLVDVPGLVGRISAIGERARAFAEMARQKDFPELASQGHALGQQLDSVAGRARELQRRPRTVS